MRLWHTELLPYLPAQQFRGQLRELVAVMHTWRDEGTPNHMLVDYITDYDKSHLLKYFKIYAKLYEERYGKPMPAKWHSEFEEFCGTDIVHGPCFPNHHNLMYLKICMANLLEKHIPASKNRVTDEEWETLIKGYETSTGVEYCL